MGGRWLAVFGAVPLLASVFAGCSEAAPKRLGNGSVFESGSSSGSSGSSGGFQPPPATTTAVCESLGSATACDCTAVPLFGTPPLLYFVLDASGSMSDGNKWNDVRAAVLDVMQKIGNRARFGIWVYPSSGSSSACNPGQEQIPPVLYDKAPGERGTVFDRAQRALSASYAGGGTPTAAALQTLGFQLPTPTQATGKTFVLLATDGAPNCNVAASCSIDKCIPNITGYPGCNGSNNCCAGNGMGANCIDDAVVPAISALKQRDISTFVLGIPGTEAFTTMLDQMAEAGGTARTGGTAKYYQVGSGATALQTALKQVLAKAIGTCTVDLAEVPAAPDTLNVFFDGVVVPGAGADGWSVNGRTITFTGTSCDKIRNGDVLELRVLSGCPTFIER